TADSSGWLPRVRPLGSRVSPGPCRRQSVASGRSVMASRLHRNPTGDEWGAFAPGEQGQSVATARVRVSVVIPAYNEVHTVDEIVRRALDAPVNLGIEVIVVDDGSTDGTAEKIAAVAVEDPTRVRV